VLQADHCDAARCNVVGDGLDLLVGEWVHCS
jgi:hypothetical protein